MQISLEIILRLLIRIFSLIKRIIQLNNNRFATKT